MNQAGSDSWRARLTVTSPEDYPPPVIILGPANQTLPLKSVAIMMCKAMGNPVPVITWYKNGAAVIADNNRLNISETGTLNINGNVKYCDAAKMQNCRNCLSVCDLYYLFIYLF